MSDKPKPVAAPAAIPYLIVKDGPKAIEFYIKAFGAVEHFRLPGPDEWSVMHCEMAIGDSTFFVSGGFKGMDVAWPSETQWPAFSMHVVVENADAAFQQAVDAGCRVIMPLANAFWGDRYGKLADPYGHQWSIAQHIEDVPPEEVTNRAAALNSGSGKLKKSP